MIENIIDFYKRIGQYNYSEAAGVTKGKLRGTERSV